MTNVLLIGDLHLSDNPPVSCTESYTDDLFELLAHTVELATEYNAITVWAGDIFHLKGPTRNSHALVQRTIDIVHSYTNGLYIVPGNHDLSNDRLDSIKAQPLGVLFKAGARYLNGWAGNTEGPDFPIYGVPWLQRFTDSAVSDSLRAYRDSMWTDESTLVITHAPLYPPGKELPYENYSTVKWAKSAGNKGNTFYGHVHDPHGVYEVDGMIFCNNGSLSRGALTESHRTREVVATLWSSINGQFKTLSLPYKPSSEVFRIEEIQTVKTAKLQLDDFLKSVGYVTMETTSIDSVLKHIRGLELGSEVESLVTELLNSTSIR